MDPNANLTEQRKLAAKIIRDAYRANPRIDAQKAVRLAELVCALDNWLETGGFLPRSWDPAEIHRQVIEDARANR